MITRSPAVAAVPLTGRATRIESIDLLRGLVMILMALDHVRDYFHADAFMYNPVDISKTDGLVFFTRWITHFCAPVFVFLAGTSAFLVGSRRGKGELSAFLLKRGLWLIVLEVTVVNFAWLFNIHFQLILCTVIWALGIGMISLAAFIHLPLRAIIVVGFLLIVGHNALDAVHVAGEGADAVGWALLHEARGFSFPAFFLYIGYPVIPWIGIMLLGYSLGTQFQAGADANKRHRLLVTAGIAAIVLFVVLRWTNAYGDPVSWTTQADGVHTFLSFMNVAKYPPSLLYILATLGPAMLFLAFAEKYNGRLAQYMIALGRVPMFYYILHLYLIHLLAVAAALATGYDVSDMIFSTWVTDSANLKGYGFSLGVTYLVWIGVVLALFPLCLWYDRYKSTHRNQWWLSYL